MLKLKHDSRVSRYRSPYGALPENASVKLEVSLQTDANTTVQSVALCYAYGLNQFRESRIRMNQVKAQGNATRYRRTLRMPQERGLFFYWFEVSCDEGRAYFTVDPDSLVGGARRSEHRPHFHHGSLPQPLPWQITVHAADLKVPDWLIGNLFYQIFPDRYRRDRDFDPQRFDDHAAPERIHHDDWEEDVDFRGKEETGYLACDFFGGSLAGIEENLDHIAELGAGAIYLNPIFQARSNHRYDTGDYENIDPLLGDVNAFRRLCRKAKERGIHIMLDGVFSHTGADSRYFNKLGRYEGTGAYQEAIGQGLSEYSSWYGFHRRGDDLTYDSWWGFPDLPSVNEYDLAYMDYITGEKGIVRRWLKEGASGWRLDVSDELPDAFLRAIHRAARMEKDDAAIMGEVWENASHKISYGAFRDFLFGPTHDTIMGYPFQQALTGWLCGAQSTEGMAAALETLREQYPLPCFYSSFNLISSHDIPRAITQMAGDPDPGSREQQATMRLSDEQRQRGEKLMRLAFFFQIMFPGSPSIYYGDELGMEGYRDPFNRRTFPQTIPQDHDLLAAFQKLGPLRRQWSVLRRGHFRFLEIGTDHVVLCRSFEQGKDVFGQDGDGPQKVVAALQRSDQTLAISVEGTKETLPPYGALLWADGETIRL